MPHGPYKTEKERRLAATFSIREERARYFREALALELGHEPTTQECIEAMRHVAQQGIDAFIKQKIEFEGAIIV
jgi:hypothetical protein